MTILDPLVDRTLWISAAVTPPACYDTVNDRFVFGPGFPAAGQNLVTFRGVGSPLGGTLPISIGFTWTIAAVSVNPVLFKYRKSDGTTGSITLGTAAASGIITLTDHDRTILFNFRVTDNGGDTFPAQIVYLVGADTSFNCDCQVDPGARQLLSLRNELLVRAGYGSQGALLPPGVKDQFTSYLRSAQDTLYRRYKPLQTERFFSWRLKANTRYYGLINNAQSCAVELDRYRIRGAWLQDPNGRWTPLARGIDPIAYTSVSNTGYPSNYEVRECLEIFPAVNVGAAYRVWIKGNFGLSALAADTDYTTIDPEPVFLWALGLAKSHKGDRDAGNPTPGSETGYYGQAISYLKSLVGGSHGNARYVPGMVTTPAATPPTMVTFL